MDNVTDAMREKWKKQASSCVKAGEQGYVNLSEWETMFVHNMVILLSQDRDLSFKQSSALGRIYARIQ